MTSTEEPPFIQGEADALVLGCAGLADLAAECARRFALPVIGGVAAAVLHLARVPDDALGRIRAACAAPASDPPRL